jgi:hypothetical protein
MATLFRAPKPSKGTLLAKPNYQFEKRQRDLAKKAKQEEKRRQKLAGKSATDDQGGDAAANPVDSSGSAADDEIKPDA